MMSEAEIDAALSEAEMEAWAELRERLGPNIDRMVAATGDLGQSVADACRQMHRAGWLRGYKRGLERQPGGT